VRWPGHRHQHDDQLATLLEKSKHQAEQLAELNRRIAKLEAATREAAPPPVPAPPVAP
jgi:hypothetical protein